MANEPALDADPKWQASSFCNNGNCVEVALLSSDTIGVRDNKYSHGPVLQFSATEWSAFIADIAAQQ
jgi:hypothetical protein